MGATVRNKYRPDPKSGSRQTWIWSVTDLLNLTFPVPSLTTFVTVKLVKEVVKKLRESVRTQRGPDQKNRTRVTFQPDLLVNSMKVETVRS